MPEDIATEDEESCGNPCHPDQACDECAPYWQRMVAECLWDKERGRWTDAGWRDIVTHA